MNITQIIQDPRWREAVDLVASKVMGRKKALQHVGLFPTKASDEERQAVRDAFDSAIQDEYERRKGTLKADHPGALAPPRARAPAPPPARAPAREEAHIPGYDSHLTDQLPEEVSPNTEPFSYAERLLALDVEQGRLTTAAAQAAALEAAGKLSLGDIAEELQIGKKTLWRWRQTKEYKAAVSRLVVERARLATRRMTFAQLQAVETLLEALDAMKDGQPHWQPRVKAAETLLSFGGQFARGERVELTAHVQQQVSRAEREMEGERRRTRIDELSAKLQLLEGGKSS